MKQAYFKYILSLLLFGSNGVVASFIGLDSYEIVLLRSLLGSIFLIAVFFLTGQKLTVLHNKKDLIYIVLAGISLAANWLFLFEAYATIGVSLGMLISYCGPAIVVALSPLIFKERLTTAKLIALTVTLTGVFLVSGKVTTGTANTRGIICAVLSAVAYAGMIIFNKKTKKIKGLESSTLQLIVTLITVAVFTFFKQGFYIQIAAEDWLPVLWVGLINTGVCCYLYFSSLGQLPVQTVAICGYIEPLTAVFFSVIILHEVLQPIQILGALLIIGGALFTEGNLNTHKKKYIHNIPEAS